MITEKPQYEGGKSPALQFLIFAGLTLGLVLLGSLIALGAVYLIYGLKTVQQVSAMNLSTPKAISAMWLMQIVGTTLPLLLVPIVFGKWVIKEPEAYLRTNTKFPPVLMLIVFSIMVMSTPILEVLILVNRNMVLPQFLKGVEDWMRATEQAAQKATEALLKMNNLWDLAKSVLLVGLVTAVAEELMFRGCLQTIMIRWTNNTHIAIWITAALFSAFHMEFFGFLPRLMLGVFFGYFAAWSGSVWPAVWGHFINNASSVVITYLYQHKKISIDPDGQYSFNYSLYILSIIITVALFWNYRTAALQKNDL
jgi:membrane protease YdiL (CAAX protease family)